MPRPPKELAAVPIPLWEEAEVQRSWLAVAAEMPFRPVEVVASHLFSAVVEVSQSLRSARAEAPSFRS